MTGWMLLQLSSTWLMVGLIWFVQIVHYPMFGKVGTDSFVEYERIHQSRTTWVVGPVMLVELFSAIACVLFAFQHSVSTTDRWVHLIGLCLLGLIWISTAAVQVPLHNRLSAGFDAEAHRLLVSTNWIRTILWSARGFLLFRFIRVA